uniref:DUF1963 domain-containing protein n=1 Tax=Caenorhabditis tropicalis TaxID=1561998 RepID=A0A1I7UID4_9PELO
MDPPMWVVTALIESKTIEKFSIEYNELDDEDGRFINILGDPYLDTPTSKGWTFDGGEESDELWEVTQETSDKNRFCFIRCQ